tara:strand:+ start:330 stop:1115 length:786 start_codon:yes stop_codon:yes gene_type:complete
MKVYILLPAFNEELSIPRILYGLNQTMEKNKLDYTVILCNDGSSDRTKEIIQSSRDSYPIHFIDHKINRGLGETSRDNFEAAAELSNNEDIIIRMDCDDTHEPIFILDLIKKIKEGYDVVIASRFQKGGGQQGVNSYRKFISYGANIFMKCFFPIKGVRDYSCGYRAYSAGIIKKAIKNYGNSFIQLKGLGFTCTLEKLLKLKLLNANFSEIPFVLRYDKKQGASKMVTSLTTFGYFSLVLLYYWPWGGWRSNKNKFLSHK